MRLLVVLTCIALASPLLAKTFVPPSEAESIEARATASAEKVEDIAFYLQERRDMLRLAEEGEYGRLNRTDMTALRTSMERMESLLEGRSTAMELTIEQRIHLYNAQEAFTSVIQYQRDNAMVCRRIAQTGSRIPVTECLTVAEREARRRNDREVMDRLPRPTCVAGEGGAGGSC